MAGNVWTRRDCRSCLIRRYALIDSQVWNRPGAESGAQCFLELRRAQDFCALADVLVLVRRSELGVVWKSGTLASKPSGSAREIGARRVRPGVESHRACPERRQTTPPSRRDDEDTTSAPQPRSWRGGGDWGRRLRERQERGWPNRRLDRLEIRASLGRHPHQVWCCVHSANFVFGDADAAVAVVSQAHGMLS